MFTMDNKKIGMHLADLINKSIYKSDRQFGIAYLRLRYGTVESDDIQKMANRICQIKKGNKGVQIEDLPVFAELLGVSIEDILSAGTALVPASRRVTNYSIAYSKDPAEWNAYLNREDKLFLNPDEYDKTVIDYALEAGNYPFLKFLMDNDYIWFVGNEKKEYYVGFGAGTSIKRREIGFHDCLEYRMKTQDDLRFKMISLAIGDKDFEMLDRLHAREIPMLYTLNHVMHYTLKDKKLPESSNVETMIQSIAASQNTVLAYFMDAFEVESERSASPNTFVFPYAGSVLDLMVKQKKKNASLFIERAISYNKSVLKNLLDLIEESIKSGRDFFKDANNDFYDEAYYKQEAWREYYIYPETGFVAFTTPIFKRHSPMRGFITNIIHMTATSSDSEVQFLIDELNKTYNTFVDYFEEKEV